MSNTSPMLQNHETPTSPSPSKRLSITPTTPTTPIHHKSIKNALLFLWSRVCDDGSSFIEPALLNLDSCEWEPFPLTSDIEKSPTIADGYGTVQLGKNIFLFGGANKQLNIYNGNIYKFDISRRSWNVVTTLFSQIGAPNARFYHTMEALDDKSFLIFGGIDEKDKPLSDGFIYNTRTSRKS
eukprot:CAMPEP_0117430586 /NCGR_PEP_ID=MMETSP0758-20121206/10130_1 /TAXON_ID=63605 /ORGANISM="Percolomonas cosmopolitus, Strain AE-1 (ATCC 50343)" /LENGTH=181 /DNA_ID=CAMNT_0005218763 /DNA_START=84 /DNA_END=629 /DNA_ORIENTATION=+